MPADPPDPIAEVHRLLDRKQAQVVSWAIPPVIFGLAALGGLVAELPELALTLGIAALLSGMASGAMACERLRKIRALRKVLDRGANPP